MKRATIIFSMMTVIAMSSCDKQPEKYERPKSGQKEIRVETMTVKENSPTTILNYSGIVVPFKNTPLSFQMPGRVTNILVDEGDRVVAGQLLAELDKTSARSSYQMALAAQEQAQDAYDRLAQVYSNGSLPEIQWEEVKSKLHQANGALVIAEQNLKNMSIYAPKSGVIGERNIEVGATVAPGITAFDLLDIQQVYVRISVPENEIRKIKKGQEAWVSIPAAGNEIMYATVKKIGVVANLISKTYEVKLLLDNPQNLIRPGMACDININLKSEETAILLPYKAIDHDAQNQAFVYKVDPGTGKVNKQFVQIATFANNEVLVESGAEPGDRIVIAGLQKLYDGASVTF